MGIAGLGVAVCTAIASGSFIVALNHATVANVLFMQAVSPIAAALLAWIALGEPITRRAGLAMVVALLGVGLMVGGPGQRRPARLRRLGRDDPLLLGRHRHHPSPARHLDDAGDLPLAAARSSSSSGRSPRPRRVGQHDLVFLVLMGVGQMGLGLVLFTMGARLIVASEVALITLLEVVLGPFWAWVAVSETPALMTVVGGAVVVAAVLLQTTENASRGLSRRLANGRRRGSRPAPAASPLPGPSDTASGARRRRRE